MSCVIKAGIALKIERFIFSRRNLKFGTHCKNLQNGKFYPILTRHVIQDGRQRQLYSLYWCQYFKIICEQNMLKF